MQRAPWSVSDAASRPLVSLSLGPPARRVPQRLPRGRKRPRHAVATALLCAIAAVAVSMLLQLSQRPAHPALAFSAAAAPPEGAAAVVAAAAPEAVAAPEEAAPAWVQALDPAVAPAPTAPLVAVAPPPPPAPVSPGMRLRIPRIGVDAPMLTMGLGAGGQMPAPADDSSVAWYDFSAAPGAPGNVLLAGHVDWVDHAAVFWHLKTLVPGDAISVTSAGQSFVYVVNRVYSVPFDITDTAPIVGRRSGPATLTIVTCAGTFNAARHLYEQRLVVVGSLRS